MEVGEGGGDTSQLEPPKSPRRRKRRGECEAKRDQEGVRTFQEMKAMRQLHTTKSSINTLKKAIAEEKDTIDALSKIDAKNKEKEALEKQIKNFEELGKSEEDEVPSSSSTDNPERLSLYFDYPPPELH